MSQPISFALLIASWIPSLKLLVVNGAMKSTILATVQSELTSMINIPAIFSSRRIQRRDRNGKSGIAPDIYFESVVWSHGIVRDYVDAGHVASGRWWRRGRAASCQTECGAE